MKRLLVAITALLFAAGSLYAQGTTYAYHIVQKGETLYRISVNNKVKINELKALNPQIVGDNIKPGDFIKLPYQIPTGAGTNTVETPPPPSTPMPSNADDGTSVVIIDGIRQRIKNADQAIQHVKDTPIPVVPTTPTNTLAGSPAPLSTPSPSVSIDDLRPYKHVVKTGETLFALAKNYNQSLKALRNWNLLDGNSIKVGMNLIVGWYFPEDKPAPPDPSKMSPSEREFYYKSQNSAAYKQISKMGIATVFEDGGTPNSMYALHKTAPPYSIIKVVNPTNQAVVYVKVLGSLPNEVGNENVLLKLTSSAAQKLDLLDQRTVVEVMHHVKRR